MKIVKAISSVTQTKINVALLALYSTVSCFTKTTVQFFYEVRANDEHHYRECHWRVQVLIFFFVEEVGLFDWRFDGLPVIRIRRSWISICLKTIASSIIRSSQSDGNLHPWSLFDLIWPS